MRILLSAYDCNPFAGSEAGVGWNWALHLARRYEVTVLTREAHRASIERYPMALPDGLTFEYFDNPARERMLSRIPFRPYVTPYLYYRVWQSEVLGFAQRLHERSKFDVAQHITWGAWRQPSHLHRLGIPLVFGPLGGGDTTPRQLRRSLDFMRQASEAMRDAGNWAHLLFPSLWNCMDKALLIICRTEGTRHYVPKRYWHKTYIRREIGVDSSRIASTVSSPAREGALRVLYVGRFLGLKGIHLAVKAFASFYRRHPGGAYFDLVGGRGDYRDKIQALIVQEGVQEAVRIQDWMPHETVQGLYRDYDVFIFPSFRDSGGTAVLESLAGGLPVICLDLGGPPKMLAGKGGIVVPAHTQTEQEVVAGLAQALEDLHASPERLRRLKEEALVRARELTWEQTVDSVYRLVEEALRRPDSTTRR